MNPSYFALSLYKVAEASVTALIDLSTAGMYQVRRNKFNFSPFCLTNNRLLG